MNPKSLDTFVKETSIMHKAILCHSDRRCVHTDQSTMLFPEEPLEKAACTLSRVILKAYLRELEVHKDSPVHSDVDLFRNGGQLASTVDDVVELICSQVLDGGNFNAESMAELCAGIYAELMSNSSPMGLPDVFKQVVRATAELALFNSWEDVYGRWNEALRSRTTIGADDFRMFRNVSSFFGCLHSTGLISHEYFDSTVKAILESYTAGSLELLAVVIVNLFCSGGVTVWDVRIDSRADNWDTILRQLANMEGNCKRFDNARWRLYNFVAAFYKMPACIGQLRFSSCKSPVVGGEGWMDLERTCKELEQWADQRLVATRSG